MEIVFSDFQEVVRAGRFDYLIISGRHSGERNIPVEGVSAYDSAGRPDRPEIAHRRRPIAVMMIERFQS